jgi:GPH family glycoside/pentoside/hexuronide:cation symporter
VTPANCGDVIVVGRALAYGSDCQGNKKQGNLPDRSHFLLNQSSADHRPQLGTAQTIAYGFGQFAWASKDVCFHYFLFFFYTQYLGLSASLAGLAAMLALIADGISDPLIGSLSDNWKSSRWGRRHPFMLAAILPYAGALIAIFNPPEVLTQGQLFAWYLVLAILVRTLLTAFTVPHMALGAELTEDYAQRTAVATYRNTLGYLGGLTIQVFAWFLIIPAATAAGDVSDGYRNIGVFAAGLAVVGMLVAIFGTRARIPFLVATSEAQQNRPWYYAFKDILAVLRNHSVAILFFASLVMVTRVGVSNTLLLHVNTFVYGFSSEQTGVFMLAILLTLVPAFLLAMIGAKRLGKRGALLCFIFMELVFAPVAVMGFLYGIAPAAGTTGLVLFVCVFTALHQMFYIAGINVVGAMLPDVADELQVTSGLRQEGILNSAMMLTQKVSFGLGSFIAGLFIDFAGFEGVTDIGDVTSSMTMTLGWLYGPGLMLFTIVGLVIYSRYRLSEQRYNAIRLQLNGESTAMESA